MKNTQGDVLTKEALARAMHLASRPRDVRPMYFVPPNMVKLGVLALAYLHGFLTRLEYGRLYHLEVALLRGEGKL